MIDSMDKKRHNQTRTLQQTETKKSYDESNEEQRWMHFVANSAWYGPPLRSEWISLQQQHATLVALCEFEKDPPENHVKIRLSPSGPVY
jgi:hypothetical protein